MHWTSNKNDSFLPAISFIFVCIQHELKTDCFRFLQAIFSRRCQFFLHSSDPIRNIYDGLICVQLCLILCLFSFFSSVGSCSISFVHKAPSRFRKATIFFSPLFLFVCLLFKCRRFSVPFAHVHSHSHTHRMKRNCFRSFSHSNTYCTFQLTNDVYD